MDRIYIDMLSDSLGVPGSYLDDVNQQEAGNLMLALTGFRLVGVSARVGLETLLYNRSRGAGRGFYQYLSTLKSWATKAPYERPWCLSPDEFSWAAPQVVKGTIPGRDGEDWFLRNIKHAFSFFAITAVGVTVFPESSVLAAAGVAGRVVGGVAGVRDLTHVVSMLTGVASVQRAYEVEVRRREYHPFV